MHKNFSFPISSPQGDRLIGKRPPTTTDKTKGHPLRFPPVPHGRDTRERERESRARPFTPLSVLEQCPRTMSSRHSSQAAQHASSSNHANPVGTTTTTTPTPHQQQQQQQQQQQYRHHHPNTTPARITRGAATNSANAAASAAVAAAGPTTPATSAQDMRVPAFPIDPNLAPATATATPAVAGGQQQVQTLATSTPVQPLATAAFAHHYDTRPRPASTTATAVHPGNGTPDSRAAYNAFTTAQDYHQHTTTPITAIQQTPQTDYSGYDTSFGTDDQGGGTPSQLMHSQPNAAATAQLPGTPTPTDPESQEIRRLAFAALAESIETLASRTRAEENGPNGEKARQMFGMSWLMRNCEVSNGATPRNRVYARYVGLCASEKLKPLNPASFGKLVRAVYPDIKTRRLGVRGQSKYHYCGIKLREDDPNVLTPDMSAELEEYRAPFPLPSGDCRQLFVSSCRLLTRVDPRFALDHRPYNLDMHPIHLHRPGPQSPNAKMLVGYHVSKTHPSASSLFPPPKKIPNLPRIISQFRQLHHSSPQGWIPTPLTRCLLCILRILLR